MADNKKNNTQAKVIEGAVFAKADTQPVVTVDYKRYAHYLDNSDLTEDEKAEYLQTIWNIICEFVSLGFGVHPLQQIDDACGKDDQATELSTILTPELVELNPIKLTKSFEENAQPIDAKKAVGG